MENTCLHQPFTLVLWAEQKYSGSGMRGIKSLREKVQNSPSLSSQSHSSPIPTHNLACTQQNDLSVKRGLLSEKDLFSLKKDCKSVMAKT